MKNDADALAAAARTLEHMRTYMNAAVPVSERAALLHELAQMPIEELAAMNAVQAEHALEQVLSSRRRASPAFDGAAVICASRASALAMTQSRMVASRLALHGIATTIVTITTTGDRVQDRPLVEIGSESLFVKELEVALREGRAQYAVHSCKDLPSSLPPDMRIAAISSREDPRDAYCSERYPTFESLPAGARVGTSSARRRAQLAAARNDLRYDPIRGNVDTRLRKLREGEYDAIVLACAGLARLGVKAAHTVPFDPAVLVPAVAQGALAVETRHDEAQLAQVLREAVNDGETERAVLCERAALHALRGGCQAPIGIHARHENGELAVEGVVAAIDGSTIVRETLRAKAEDVSQAQALGAALAQGLLAKGAERLLAMPKDSA